MSTIFRRVALATALVGAAAFAGFTTAYAVTWDFQSPNNTSVISPHDYADNGAGTYHIIASGFKSTTGTSAWVLEKLYDKNASGEKGLGINSDPTGNHEIWGTHFIQIDVGLARTAGLALFSFQMDSSTQLEGWKVYGSNSTGIGAVLTFLMAGTDQLVHSLLNNTVPNAPAFRYYDFFYDNAFGHQTGQNDNVLIHQFSGVTCPPTVQCETTTVTPIPGALPLFASGLGVVGLLGWRRRRRHA
jgi:hypothetical protein